MTSQPIKNQVEWQDNLYFKRINEFKEHPIGFNKIVFLGNSLTEGGKNWNKRFNSVNIINRGISGDFTSGIIARLDEIFYYQPIAIFLLIGLNDIFGINDPLITAEYVADQIKHIAKLIKKNCPETKLYVQTILPIDEDQYLKINGSYPKHNEPLPEKIRKINNLLINHDFNFYERIDLHTSFLNKDQQTISSLFKDGVHLNEEGYQLWAKIIRKHVKNYTIQEDIF